MRQSGRPKKIVLRQARRAHWDTAAGARTFLSAAIFKRSLIPVVSKAVSYSDTAADRNVRAPFRWQCPNAPKLRSHRLSHCFDDRSLPSSVPMPETPFTTYDTVLYPSETHPQTHPNRLAVIGTLFGLNPAPMHQCRVLELGCGNGSNLVPMAWALPQSEFAGIDLASRPIAQGQQMIQDLGMKNVRLVHGDVTKMNEDWGKFDYIIAHGLYSWVPPEVREQVLTVCRRLLAPQGVAFVSYNALPGGHLRQMVSEMMLFHVRGCDDPEERVRQGVALVRFLAEGQDTRDEYRLWMKAELARIIQHDAGHLFHDELSEENQPFYFTQFMERAAANGLRYLGEADYSEMSDHAFTESVRRALQELAPNRLLREQYLDFLKCRPFRQTLLCLQEANVLTEPRAEKVAGFVVSSSAVCAGTADLRPGVSCSFQTPQGSRFETDLALGKAALVALAAAWPLALRFDELVEQAALRLRQAGIAAGESGTSRDELAAFLLRLYAVGIVEFRTSLPPITLRLSEKPTASPVARWQAERGEMVASLLHIGVRVEDEIGRRLLGWLDGTRDRKALVEELLRWLESKNPAVASGNGEAARRELEMSLEKNLTKMAKLGLLVG